MKMFLSNADLSQFVTLFIVDSRLFIRHCTAYEILMETLRKSPNKTSNLHKMHSQSKVKSLHGYLEKKPNCNKFH